MLGTEWGRQELIKAAEEEDEEKAVRKVYPGSDQCGENEAEVIKEIEWGRGMRTKGRR